MTTPLWVLLGFAGWTLCLLLATVGVYRWGLILTRRAAITDFPADAPRGTPFYRRAMRAHANCVENLPVYGAIAVCGALAGVQNAAFDTLALVLLAARIAQSLVHVAFAETKATVAIRFGFYFAQLASMVAMGAIVVAAAADRDSMQSGLRTHAGVRRLVTEEGGHAEHLRSSACQRFDRTVTGRRVPLRVEPGELVALGERVGPGAPQRGR